MDEDPSPKSQYQEVAPVEVFVNVVVSGGWQFAIFVPLKDVTGGFTTYRFFVMDPLQPENVLVS